MSAESAVTRNKRVIPAALAMGLAARLERLTRTALVLAMSVLLARVIVFAAANARWTHQQAVVVGGVFGLAAVAVAVTFLLRATELPTGRGVGGLYAAPVIVMGFATSVFANGIGYFLSHQIAWAALGVLFVAATLRNATPFKRVLPAWLLLYGGLGITLELAQSWGLKPILDIGLSILCLFVMWQIACALRQPGSVTRFLAVVAGAYWAVTVAAVVVFYSGVGLGSMSRSMITLPWQGPLGNIFVSGDYQGYGFITTQAGREITFVVCLYHLVRWRYTKRSLHATLTALAFLLFLTTYGRAPFIGGILGLGIAALTTRAGTQGPKLAAASLIVLFALVASGASGKLTNLNSRVSSSHSFDTGHISVWSQHLGLFAQAPLTGVGGSPTAEQMMATWQQPVLTTTMPLPPEELLKRGSRGEGGWTSLLAQRGIIEGGIIVALLGLAARFIFTRFPRDPEGQQDMMILRAVIPASFVFYVTDVAPMSIYTVTAYVLGQLTMIAAVRGIAQRQNA